MSDDDPSLPDDLATARSLIIELTRTVHLQNQLVAKLQHQLEQLLRQKFGKKGEAADPAQLLLFAPEVAELLEPIVREMTRRVLASKVIGSDDTPVKVQDHQGQGVKTGHLWAYIGDRDHRFVVYD